MSTSPTIAVIGEAVIDLVQDADGRFTAHSGGSPLNVAVAAARLGAPAQLWARLSGSAFGRQLRAHAAASGVDLSHAVAAAEPASLAVVSLGPDGSAEYEFHVTGSADWQWSAAELGAVGDAGIVHTGSLACFLSPGADAIEAALGAARARGALVTFDPNVRPSLLPAAPRVAARTLHLASFCDVVKASDADLAFLYPGSSLEEVARRWLAAGPRLVVITQGAGGALAVTATEVVHRPAPVVEVVDTVGAGDAFMGALLTSLRRVDDLDRPTLERLLDVAITVAAITCTRAGANPPTRAEL